MALTLFTTWAARTGRVLRNAPISELTPEELVEFWADDQLEESYSPATGAPSTTPYPKAGHCSAGRGGTAGGFTGPLTRSNHPTSARTTEDP